MSGFLLQLGDIIRIISPKDPDYHGKTFFVYYYDPNGFMGSFRTLLDDGAVRCNDNDNSLFDIINLKLRN